MVAVSAVFRCGPRGASCERHLMPTYLTYPTYAQQQGSGATAFAAYDCVAARMASTRDTLTAIQQASGADSAL
jgi:hypothetical protein